MYFRRFQAIRQTRTSGQGLIELRGSSSSLPQENKVVKAKIANTGLFKIVFFIIHVFNPKHKTSLVVVFKSFKKL